VVEIREVLRQGLAVAQHVGELLGHLGRVTLIVVNSQSLIAVAAVREQPLQRSLLQKSIHLFG